MLERPLGIVVGESTLDRVVARMSRKPMKGEYVIIEDNEGGMESKILAMVENVVIKNRMIEDNISMEELIKLLEWGEKEVYTLIFAHLKPVADLEIFEREGKIAPPESPPSPGSIVKEVPEKTLKSIFSKTSNSMVEIGKLLRYDIPFYVDVNEVVSRHLAVLAITGGGKSNTVAVLADEITKLGGPILIFDMHGEYQDAFGAREKPIQLKINPRELSVRELMKLLGVERGAYKQEMFLRYIKNLEEIFVNACVNGKCLMDRENMFFNYIRLLEIASSHGKIPVVRSTPYAKMQVTNALRNWIANYVNNNKTLNNPLIQAYNYLLNGVSKHLSQQGVCKVNDCSDIVSYVEITSGDKNSSIPSLIAKIESLMERYQWLFDVNARSIVDQIERGKVHIVDLSKLDLEAADVLTSHMLEEILRARKSYVTGLNVGRVLKWPLLIVIEEAHALVPRDADTLTKWIAGRIAREGRKFGVGLCLVSQRPKNVDQNVLSQMNNMIVLRIKEPSDQRYVQQASEAFSEELVAQLPNLGVGEAIVIGPMTKIPAIVKIKRATFKKKGTNVDVLESWGDEGAKTADGIPLEDDDLNY